MEYLCSTPGKRIRPRLTVLAYEACGVTSPYAAGSSGGASSTMADREAVLEIAAAVELIHMASLVHDDIIDRAEKRRGKPTVHMLWGIHSAVLAGDYLFTRANKIALRYPRYSFASLFNQAIELTCEGETYQDERLFDPNVTQQEYSSYICKKTAALMGVACQAGAVLAGAGEEVENTLLRFGIELGCAFQMADDVLDFTGDVATCGKQPCNDLKRGLLTLPTILAMGGELGPLISNAFEKRAVSDDLVAIVRDGLISEGYMDSARDRARDLALSARSRLELLPHSGARAALGALAQRVAFRMGNLAVRPAKASSGPVEGPA